MRSIGAAAIQRPNPPCEVPRCYDCCFPKIHRRLFSLPLLGPIADSFDDWLASNGYTQISRKHVIRDLPHLDAELRRRHIKEISNLTRGGSP